MALAVWSQYRWLADTLLMVPFMVIHLGNRNQFEHEANPHKDTHKHCPHIHVWIHATNTDKHTQTGKIKAKIWGAYLQILNYWTYKDSLFNILNTSFLERRFSSSASASPPASLSIYLSVSRLLSFFCLHFALSSPRGSDDWCACVCFCVCAQLIHMLVLAYCLLLRRGHLINTFQRGVRSGSVFFTVSVCPKQASFFLFLVSLFDRLKNPRAILLCFPCPKHTLNSHFLCITIRHSAYMPHLKK